MPPDCPCSAAPCRVHTAEATALTSGQARPGRHPIPTVGGGGTLPNSGCWALGCPLPWGQLHKTTFNLAVPALSPPCGERIMPPLCDSPSGCCFFTGPWTVTRSSLRMLRRVAAFCRPLRPVLLLVSFPRSRSPVVGVLGLCWMWRDVPFVHQRRPIIGVLRMCWLLPPHPLILSGGCTPTFLNQNDARSGRIILRCV